MYSCKVVMFVDMLMILSVPIEICEVILADCILNWLAAETAGRV